MIEIFDGKNPIEWTGFYDLFKGATKLQSEIIFVFTNKTGESVTYKVFKVLSNKIICILVHQTKYQHVRKLILLLINNIFWLFHVYKCKGDSHRPNYTKMFLLCLKRVRNLQE